MSMCKKCLVSGRVQGVFFRAATQQKAASLGLRGWARNLPDGRVEVLICGDEDRAGELCEWLWQGPPQAEVTGVICEPAEDRAPAGFEKR